MLEEKSTAQIFCE
jgi:hypothetical protein